NAPAVTVSAGLVSAVFDGSLTSETVRVREPPVLNRTERVIVPLASATLAGRLAFASVLLKLTVSVTDDTMFQYASTALTVTEKLVPAATGEVGVPVLPDAVPAA